MTTTNSNAALALDFVVLYVSDVEAFSQHLTKQLGFIQVVEGAGPSFRYLTNAEGSPGIGIQQATEQTPVAGSVQLFFKTPALSNLHNEISGRGVKLEPIQQMPFGAIFDVPMPDNLLVTMLGKEK